MMKYMSSDKELERLRRHIDAADQNIVEGLKERMEAVLEIGEYKSENEKDVHDPKRVKEVLDTRATMGGKNLSPEFMRELFRMIIKYSEELQ